MPNAAVWQTSLPSSGYKVVNTVVANDASYAGSNGYVYKLGASDGKVEATNGLSGYGYNEVRLTYVADKLVIGTDGYVLGLDRSDLTEIWSTSLPSAGYQIVSVINDGASVYAGSNGYVYRIDPSDGSIQATNSLSGYGSHEIRLIKVGDQIIVGMNGYVHGLKASDLTTQWSTSLPSSGYQVVNLCASGSSIFVGSNGYVYKLDTSGSVLHTNGLSGYGYNEVRLAHDPGSSQLFVGTDGYALGLSADDLSENWSTSLPSTGYKVVSMAFYDEIVYAASNGYVYGLDCNSGAVIRSEGLSGLGYNEIRLSLDGSTVVMGTDGFVACSPISISNYNMESQQETNWCWAAVTVSSALFLNSATSWNKQCEMVNKALGEVTCCIMGSSSECNKAWYLDRALTIAQIFDKMTSNSTALNLIGSEIGQGLPLGARIGWSGGGGHFVVVTGVHPDGTVTAQDSIYGTSTMMWDAFANRYQGSGSWTHSYYLKS